MSIEQFHGVIARVLRVSWTSPNERSIFLRSTSENLSDKQDVDLAELISQAIAEVLLMFAKGEDSLK